MKNINKSLVVALTLSFNAMAENTNAAFPIEVTVDAVEKSIEKIPEGKATKLTEEQIKEADANLAKAKEEYDGLIDFNIQTKLASVQSNYDYLDARLKKAEKNLIISKKKLSDMKKLVYVKLGEINRLKISKELVDKKKRDLAASYAREKEILEFTILRLEKQVKKLNERKVIVGTTLQDLIYIAGEKGTPET